MTAYDGNFNRSKLVLVQPSRAALGVSINRVRRRGIDARAAGSTESCQNFANALQPFVEVGQSACNYRMCSPARLFVISRTSVPRRLPLYLLSRYDSISLRVSGDFVLRFVAVRFVAIDSVPVILQIGTDSFNAFCIGFCEIFMQRACVHCSRCE